MQLKIRNRVITEPIINILRQARSELTNGKLKDILDKHDNVMINCPCHKNGLERRPSCSVLASTSAEDLEPGFTHCFTCGYNASLAQVITDLFDEEDITFGEDWLIERFGTTLVSSSILLPEITLDKKKVETTKFLDDSILTEYDYYHDYMWYRKLSKDIVDLFRVGYDKTRQAITFPVYDEKHRLVMVTARSVNTKRFWIPEGVDKPVYLLYHLIENNIKTAFICESQLNALYLWSLGYPSCALFGTGSSKQFEILKRSGIRNFYLVFDGDEPGRKGALRFRKNMPKDIFITDLLLPAGKDINDLSPEEVHALINNS